MRVRSFAFLLGWLSLVLTAAAATKASETGKIHQVGVFEDNYPYAFREGTSPDLQGFAVEILAGVQSVTPLETRFVVGGTAEIQQRFFAGDLDFLLSYAYSPERSEAVDFSTSYLDMVGSIFVRPEFAGLRNLEELRPLRVLVHRNSLGERALQQAGLGECIVEVDSMQDALDRMARGEGDATLATSLTGASMIEHSGYDFVQLPIEVPNYSVFYCFAVHRGDRELLAKLNEGLAVLHRSGRYEKIYAKWFGRFEPRRFTPFEILLAVCGGLLVALAVAVAAAVHQRRLRQQLSAAHQTVLQTELHYQEVFDATPVPLLVTHLLPAADGAHLRLSESNPAAWKLFQWHDHPGRVRLHDHAPQFRSLWLAAQEVRPNTSPTPTELQVDLADGQTVHLRWSAVREETRILLLVEDVTAPARAARELHLAEQRLLQSQKLDALGTLTSGIAHDFNNILASVLGNAELLRLECRSDSTTNELAGNILTASRRARDLVRQILAFSRNAEPERRDVDLRQISQETLNLLRAAVPKSIQLVWDGPDQPAPIVADATQIHQVLLNLLTNAAQAIGEANGTITLQLEQSEVRGTIDTQSPFGLTPAIYHRLAIQDTGAGMSAEVVARAFEPFFTTKKINQGTGLGLSVAHGVVQKHGGTITIDSVLGRGTTVTLWLPVSEHRTSTEPLEFFDLSPVAADAPEVLVVDDEVLVTQALDRMLRRLGCRPTLCTNPLDAMDLFNRDPARFRAVLCDLSMPERSGLEVLRSVLAARPDTPALLMTGFWSNGSRDKARDLGVRVLTEKPIGITELHRFMTELLR